MSPVPLLRLAARSAWARRLTLGVTLVAIILSTALLLCVERVRADARQSFTQSVSGVDLVVGARTGSVQLMLYAVFHAGAATNNVDCCKSVGGIWHCGSISRSCSGHQQSDIVD